jgi:hypothetical protein
MAGVGPSAMEGGASGRSRPKIIQIQPWRDLLLGLSDEGKIYRLEWCTADPVSHFVAEGFPVFNGLPECR